MFLGAGVGVNKLKNNEKPSCFFKSFWVRLRTFFFEWVAYSQLEKANYELRIKDTKNQLWKVKYLRNALTDNGKCGTEIQSCSFHFADNHPFSLPFLSSFCRFLFLFVFFFADSHYVFFFLFLFILCRFCFFLSFLSSFCWHSFCLLFCFLILLPFCHFCFFADNHAFCNLFPSIFFLFCLFASLYLFADTSSVFFFVFYFCFCLFFFAINHAFSLLPINI